ncbi:hypothetical protein ABFS82_05G034100 [Erythranthe guttata]
MFMKRSFHTINHHLHEQQQVVVTDSEEEEEEEEEEGKGKIGTLCRQNKVDEHFRVKGSRICFKYEAENGQLRRWNSGGNGPWPEFTSGKSVVKHWDSSLGLGLDFNEDLVNFYSKRIVSNKAPFGWRDGVGWDWGLIRK